MLESIGCKVTFRRFVAISGITLILASVLVVGFPLLRYASAQSNIVQPPQIGSCTSSTSCSSGVSISFSSSVTSGDVVVVLIWEVTSTPSSSSSAVTDSFCPTVSCYTLQTFTLEQSSIPPPSLPPFGALYIYTTALTQSGSDAVTISETSASAIYAEIFEVSGVTTMAAETSTGSHFCGPSVSCNVNMSSELQFSQGAFLVSAYFSYGSASNSFSNGTGFTAQALEANTVYSEYAYDNSAVVSPTIFPASISNSATTPLIWAGVGLVLEPGTETSPTMTTTETSTTTQTTTSTLTSVSTVTIPITETSTASQTETSTVTSASTLSSTVTSTTTATSTLFVYPTTTHVSCKPNKARLGQTVDCTAIVSSKKGGTLTGSITYSFSEEKIGAEGSVTCNPVVHSSSECSATFQFKFSSAGTVTVRAAYSGDQTHQSSHGATLVHVIR